MATIFGYFNKLIWSPCVYERDEGKRHERVGKNGERNTHHEIERERERERE
jgi:hypothetical protein